MGLGERQYIRLLSSRVDTRHQDLGGLALLRTEVWDIGRVLEVSKKDPLPSIIP